MLVLGGVAAAVCLVLGIGIAALVHTISSNHAQKQEAAKQAMLEQQAAEKETAAALAEAKKEEELAAQKAEETETYWNEDITEEISYHIGRAIATKVTTIAQVGTTSFFVGQVTFLTSCLT